MDTNWTRTKNQTVGFINYTPFICMIVFDKKYEIIEIQEDFKRTYRQLLRRPDTRIGILTCSCMFPQLNEQYGNIILQFMISKAFYEALKKLLLIDS